MGTRNAKRRLEREAVLRCPRCKDSPYVIFRRQNMERSGELRQSFETVLWPAHPDVDPPKHPEQITCPDCGEELQRVAK